MIDFMEFPLVRALIDETISFTDVMTSFNIQTHIAFNLSSAVSAFVYYSSNTDQYLLVMNGNINFEAQCQVFVHEISHIIRHFPKTSYYVGIDNQYSQIEKEADQSSWNIG